MISSKRNIRRLLKRPFHKDLRDRLFQFIDYLYTAGTSNSIIVVIAANYLYMQIWASSFLSMSKIVWPPTSTMGPVAQLFNSISFLYPLAVSVTNKLVAIIIINSVYIVTNLFGVAVLYSFVRTARVNIYINNVFIMILDQFLPVLGLIGSSSAGTALAYGIGLGSPLPWVAFGLSLVTVVSSVISYSHLVCSTLLFRPLSVPILSVRHSSMFTVALYLHAFFAALGSHISLYLVFISLVPLAFALLITFRTRLFTSTSSAITFRTHIIAALSLSLILPLVPLMNRHGTELVVFITAIIAYIIHFLFRRQRPYEVPETLESLSENEVIKVVHYAFSNGDRQAHNYKLFNEAFSLYPNSKELTRLYARFASIYSTDRIQLEDAILRTAALKQSDFELKSMLFQLKTLLQKREQTLTKDLSKALKKMDEKSEKSKNMVRYIWEKILRGQTDDFELMTSPLLEEETNTIRDFKQLCLVNANNPRVFLSYSQYLQNVACRFSEAEEVSMLYNAMKHGVKTRNERALFYASKCLPGLPDLDAHSEMYANSQPQNVANSSQAPVTLQKVQTVEDIEPVDQQKLHLETMLDSVRLPSLFPMVIALFLVISVVFQVFGIIFLVFFSNSLDQAEHENKFIYAFSMLRTELTNLAYLAHQKTAAGDPSWPSIKEMWESISTDSSSIFVYTDDQFLREKAQKAADYQNQLSLTASQISDSRFSKALDALFSRNVTFSLHSDFATSSQIKMSLQAISTQAISIAIALGNTPSADTLTWGPFWTVIMNTDQISNYMGEVIEDLIKSFKTIGNEEFNYLTSFLVFSYLSATVVGITVLALLFIHRRKERLLLYNSFKSIPGSSIAQILQKLSGISTNDKEILHRPKAEENAIYLLRNIAGNKSGNLRRNSMILPFTLAFLVIVIISVISVLKLNTVYQGAFPAVEQFYAAHNLHVNSVTLLLRCARLATRSNPLFNPLYMEDVTDITTKNTETLSGFDDFLLTLRKGDSQYWVLDQYLSKSDEVPIEKYKDDVAIMKSLSYENSASYLSRYFELITLDPSSVTGTSPQLAVAATWLIEDSYTNFVVPSIEKVTTTITSTVNSAYNETLLSAIFLLLFLMALGILSIIEIVSNNAKTLWSYRLLLFCEPEVILRSRPILKIMANEFSEAKETEEFGAAASNSVYEKVISHLPDAVLFMTSDFVIHSANASSETIFGIPAASLIDQPLSKILDISLPSVKSFFQAIEAAKMAMRPPSISMEVDIQRSGKSATLNISLTAISLSSEVLTKPTNIEAVAIFCLIATDMTSTIASRTLLQNEHQKGEHLLSTILPAVIVKKLQKGEKQISFAVPSSSIVFIDIVSFTPWCGSLPASQVMATLNHLFATFDNLLSKYDKMTKIKCIGDCYMAAGGLFDEVNQPSIHASQAISFCLDVIQAMDHFNLDHKSILRVRAGVNTGGPIVAGVLGIDKPTFDILGPAISLAAAMEHTGVPMLVHIPRHVYELVYDDNFKIKERGDVTVKGNAYRTYLVSGYSDR